MHKITHIIIGSTLIFFGCNPAITTLDEVIKKEIITREVPTDLNKYRCSIGAHRGDSNQYTENTIDAISSAVNQREYSFLEFDVQLSKDEKIVAYHDRTLIRLYGTFKKINDLTYAEICEKTENNIALYHEIMRITKNKHINIEIKSSGNMTKDKNLIDQIVYDLQNRNITNQVMISSISVDVVTYINQNYPSFKTGLIYWINPSTYIPFDFLTEQLFQDLNKAGASYLILHVTNLHNLEDLIKLKPKDKTIIFWNFDDKMYLVHKDPSDIVWGKSHTWNYIKHYSHILKQNIKSKLF